ncbi:hypothetical protein, partial [Salmonella enterica]|uniref:hypothetical protein n=1 Tax=Salmonella enterica TaxID=28901 RepID=UPI00398C5FA0
IVLSGFAATDLSVRFRDACQGGGAYGKTASPRPYRFPVKFHPGISQEISAPFVIPPRSPKPNGRSQRVSERGSGRAPNTQTASPRALADSLMQLARQVSRLESGQ